MLARAAVSGNSTASQILSLPVDTFTTVVGDGATSIDTTAQTISITYGTTTTGRRGTYPVTVGKRYRVTWVYSGTTGMSMYAGTSSGGIQYRHPVASDLLFDVTVTATTLHMTFQRTAAGTTTVSDLKIQEIPEVTWVDTALVSPTAWTNLSAGVTVDTTTGAITIPATGTTLAARQVCTTVAAKLYRLRWINNTNTTMCLIGSTSGGQQMKAATSSDAVGSRTYEFRATNTTSSILFQRSATGTAVVSDIQIQETQGS